MNRFSWKFWIATTIQNVYKNLDESDKKNIKKMIKNLSIKDITDLISQNKNVSKKEIYSYCLKLKNEI